MISTADVQTLNRDRHGSSRIGKLARVLAAVFLLTVVMFASQPKPAQADALEICIASCVRDYYPFHQLCVLGCIENWIVFGVHGDYGPTRPFSLAAEASRRTAIELQAGNFDEARNTFRRDSRTLAVVYSYASLADFESRSNTARIWREIGEARDPSFSDTWPLVWDASHLESGEYLLCAQFIQHNGSNEACTAFDVP